VVFELAADSDSVHQADNKFKFDRQPGSLTVKAAGEHQPFRKHP